jgi:hypothetical protein
MNLIGIIIGRSRMSRGRSLSKAGNYTLCLTWEALHSCFCAAWRARKTTAGCLFECASLSAKAVRRLANAHQTYVSKRKWLRLLSDRLIFANCACCNYFHAAMLFRSFPLNMETRETPFKSHTRGKT